MRKHAELVVVLSLAVLLSGSAVADRSRVEPVGGASGEEQVPGGDVVGCTNGIIEGPDPIGAAIECEEDPTIDRGAPDQTEQAQPVVGYHLDGKTPFMVWPDDNGRDHDIAYQSWEDGRWGPVEYLATSGEDERDPAVWVAADGAIHVAWWSGGAGVEITRRDPATGHWSVNRSVAADGTRPSLVTSEGLAIVAFERSAAAGLRVIGVAEETAAGWFDERILATFPATQPLDVELSVQDGELRVDW